MPGYHGHGESEFHGSGLFRGAIERVRGQFSATMRDRREFVRHVLNHMQDGDSSATGIPPARPTGKTTSSASRGAGQPSSS